MIDKLLYFMFPLWYWFIDMGVNELDEIIINNYNKSKERTIKYRLAKLEQTSVWYVIQKKTWSGWVIINEPGQKRIFFDEKEAVTEYNKFVRGKGRANVTVICEN